MIWDSGSPAGKKGARFSTNALTASLSPSVWPVSTRCAAFAYGFLDKQAVTLAADPGERGASLRKFVSLVPSKGWLATCYHSSPRPLWIMMNRHDA